MAALPSAFLLKEGAIRLFGKELPESDPSFRLLEWLSCWQKSTEISLAAVSRHFFHSAFRLARLGRRPFWAAEQIDAGISELPAKQEHLRQVNFLEV